MTLKIVITSFVYLACNNKVWAIIFRLYNSNNALYNNNKWYTTIYKYYMIGLFLHWCRAVETNGTDFNSLHRRRHIFRTPVSLRWHKTTCRRPVTCSPKMHTEFRSRPLDGRLDRICGKRYEKKKKNAKPTVTLDTLPFVFEHKHKSRSTMKLKKKKIKIKN